MPSFKSRLNPARQDELVRDFAAATPVFRIGDNIHHQIAIDFFQMLRELIAERLATTNPFSGIAIDVAGDGLVLERAGPEPQPLIALMRHDGLVRATLIDWEEVARGAKVTRLSPESIVYRVRDTEPEKLPGAEIPAFRQLLRSDIAADRAAFTPVVAFWKKAANHLSRYKAIPVEHLALYIAECEWRFNFGPPENQLKILKEWME